MKEKWLNVSFRYGAVVVIIGVLAFFSSTLPYFWTYDNLMDILGSIAIVTFVAIGVTLSLIVDGFDLSVGATVSLTTVVAASLMVWYGLTCCGGHYCVSDCRRFGRTVEFIIDH